MDESGTDAQRPERQAPPPEWYPDPTQRALLRQMTPTGWGPWLSDGREVWFDPRPVRRHLTPPDLASLQFVNEVLIPEARARDLVLPAPDDVRALLDDLAAEARRGPMSWGPAWADRPAIARPAVPAPVFGTGPVVAPAGFPGQMPPPARLLAHSPEDLRAAARREARRRSWDRTREAIGSELAVHGLAYLGVLLLFVGVFGLVAFAFGDVSPSVRPMAELSAAVVPFLAARLMLRHQAAVVGRALEVVGGLLVPIMAITSQVDGYPLPGDPKGPALVVVLTLVCLVSAAVFALWARRHGSSGLRYAVAPAVWLAAAMATIAVGRPVPSGQDVAVPSSHQVSAMALVLVLTLGLARLRPDARLAQATLTSGIPGVVVVALLAVLTWAADERPVVPVALTGVLLLVAVELLRTRVPAAAADVVAPLWWGAVVLTLGSVAPAGPVAAMAAAGFLVLLELAGRRGPAEWVPALPGLGLGVALAAVWPQGWWAVGALAVVAGWAALRRVRPYPAPGSAGWLDAAAAVLPAAVVVALGSVSTAPVGVVAATALVVLATVPARGTVLRRTGTDLFWRYWWRTAVPVVGVVAFLLWQGVDAVGQWQTASSLLALGLVVLVGPVSTDARPWAGTALLASAWVLGCLTGSVTSLVAGGVLAAAALVMVVAAGRTRASLGLAGHLLGAVALGPAGGDWGLVLVAALATAGWAVTAVRADRDGSAVGAALIRASGGLRYLPWAAVAVGLPTTAALALDAGGVLALVDPWMVGVPAATAVLYAAVSRVRTLECPRAVAAWAAFAAGVLAVVLAREARPAVVGLAALVATVALLPADRRVAPMEWAAWAGVAPLVGLTARQAVAWFSELPASTAVAVTLTAVGGPLLVGATAVGRSRPGARPGAVRMIGALEVGGALALAIVQVPLPDAGWVTLSVCAVLLTLAVQTGTGSLAGGSAVVAWLAVQALAWPWLESRPWVGVLVTAALLVLAEGLHRLVRDRGTWSRWDIPFVVAAAPVATTALVAAVDGDGFAATFAVVGALTVAVAVRLRRQAVVAEILGWTGTVLVLVAAADRGSGWLALAFLALAAAHTGLAVRAVGGVRLARQLVGVTAAVTAWVVALVWFAWSSQVAVDATGAGAGAVVLLAAAVARTRRVGRSWVLVWGGAAVTVVATAVVAGSRPAGLSTVEVAPSLWLVLALVAVTAGALLAARPLQICELRDLAAAGALGGVWLTLQVAQSPVAQQVAVLSALAALLAAPALALALRPAESVWTRPVVVLGAGGALVAVGMGLAALPNAALLVPAVAAAAVQVAAAGVALRSLGLQMASPALACSAWLIFASSSDRPPQWYTLGIGLALLAVVAVWRRDRRLRQLALTPGPVVGLELAGIAFLVGTPMVQAVTDSPLYALEAGAVGILVALWGVVTRVRRRVATGALVVLVAVVLLVAVPLVQLLPAWGGAGVWLLLAGVGLVAVLVATMLERGRAAVRTTLGRIGEVTADWE